MSEPLFDIVFYGIIQPGKDRDMVMQNMAALFKTQPEKIRSYFSGDRRVIKSKVDELVAEKYRAALENVGLVIKVEAVTEAAPAQDNSDKHSQQPADDDTGDMSMAAIGADLVENPVPVEPQPIGDISSLSMAETGADMIENPVAVTPQAIGDISDITLAEPGADVIANPAAITPQAIDDISNITMAEAGADVYETPPKKPEAPEIDTSELSTEESD